MKNDSGKCLHYYFYFIDPDFGLCYLRVPTWCPFRLQFYMNGHNWLASRLSKQGIAFQMKDNAFLSIADWEKAQHLSDHIRVEDLHQVLDILANRYCSVVKKLGLAYRWSIMQVEYATDIAFAEPDDLRFVYEAIVHNPEDRADEEKHLPSFSAWRTAQSIEPPLCQARMKLPQNNRLNFPHFV